MAEEIDGVVGQVGGPSSPPARQNSAQGSMVGDDSSESESESESDGEGGGEGGGWGVGGLESQVSLSGVELAFEDEDMIEVSVAVGDFRPAGAPAGVAGTGAKGQGEAEAEGVHPGPRNSFSGQKIPTDGQQDSFGGSRDPFGAARKGFLPPLAPRAPPEPELTDIRSLSASLTAETIAEDDEEEEEEENEEEKEEEEDVEVEEEKDGERQKGGDEERKIEQKVGRESNYEAGTGGEMAAGGSSVGEVFSSDARAGAATQAPPELSKAMVSEPEWDEWDEVNALRQTEKEAGGVTDEGGGQTEGAVTFAECRAWYLTQALEARSGEMAAVRDELGASAVPSVCPCLGDPGLGADLDCERVYCYALSRVGMEDPVCREMNVKILQALYMGFTGVPRPVLRFGGHWEDIGFQGNDPGTDLRSCGALALVQLYHLLEFDMKNAGHLYLLSVHEYQNFPLAVVSINVTSWALEALRRNLLNAAIRDCGSVLDAMNRFHVGTMYEFYLVWKRGHESMRTSGFVLRNLEELAKKDVARMLENCDLTLGITQA